ncbi:MAG TPA: hypothetical protein VF033_13490 [Steroidobacteraceae bacterium]|jgi:hypothetical protein
MTQITGRRLAIIRLLGVALVAWSIGALIHGHEVGEFRTGTRRNPVLLSGDDLWLGYVFWSLGAVVGVLLCLIHLHHTRAHAIAGKVTGTAFFVALGLCLLTGAQVL